MQRHNGRVLPSPVTREAGARPSMAGGPKKHYVHIV